jgi:hypothetical protein
MKITESQLKQIIRDEVDTAIEEGLLQTLGLAGALALGGGGKGDAQQYNTDTSSGDQTTQQVDVEKQATNTLQKNDDGSYLITFTAKDLFGKTANNLLGTPSTKAKLMAGQGQANMYNKLVDAGINAKDFNYQLADYEIGAFGKDNKPRLDSAPDYIIMKATPK